ncbi:alpha-amylase family protein [Chryseolinea sp. T2]|uniref:alpha-amylase family protein n=1 Tax=Chryseolinea sp. T2 TaxID=3129255 RepID=UPI003077E267
MRGLIPCLATIVLLVACSKQKEKIPPLMSNDNGSGKIAIYQVMTRLFGNKNTNNKPNGTRDENGVGKFNDIDARALKAIKEMGITHVWYTGVIEHALLTDYSAQGIPADDPDVVKGIAGSPYAIKDYYDVNPDLAVSPANRMAEFEQLVRRTHENGLKVIIDFVPNHVARRYHSDKKPAGVVDLGGKDIDTLAFSASNNFYYIPGSTFQPPKRSASAFAEFDGKFDETPAKVTGNNVFSASPSLTDWYETVKLNYGVDYQHNNATHFDPVPDTWIKMRDILKFWASKNVDGFRCDMAEMVPVEFWHWVIPQVKSENHELIFIAEIYNPALYRSYLEQGGFNYLYDKVQLYDTLRLLTSGQRSTREIVDIRQSLHGINHNMLHFLENHDEQRIASRFFAGDPWKAVPAMVVSATLDRGAVMIYFGQEVGEPGAGNEGFQGDDGRTTIYDYWGVPEHQKWMNHGRFNGDSLSAEQKQLRMFYSDLTTLATTNEAISSGEYADLTVHNQANGNFNDKVHAFVRYAGEERLLIVTTYSAEPLTIKVQIPQDIVTQMGLDNSSAYIARDLLWRDAEVGFSADYTFELKCKPFSSFIFKIK